MAVLFITSTNLKWKLISSEFINKWRPILSQSSGKLSTLTFYNIINNTNITYSSNTIVFSYLSEFFEKSFIIICVLIRNLLLPEKRYCLLEISLNSPIRPFILPRVLRVFIKEFASVESSCATFFFPSLSAACPVRFPEQLIWVNSTNCWRYFLSWISEIPSSWMTLTCLFVIIELLINSLTSPIQTVTIFHVYFLLFICWHSCWSTWILWLIWNDCGFSIETWKSSINLEISFAVVSFSNNFTWVLNWSIIEIFLSFFIWPFSLFVSLFRAWCNFSRFTLAACPDPLSTFSISNFIVSRMYHTCLIISIFSFLCWLFVDKCLSTKTIWIMRIWILISVINTIFDKSSL